jgi:outer membrane immunogenic protein
MNKTNGFASILLAGALTALPGFAQETPRSEVSVQALGSFVKTTTSNGVEQSATNSGGVLASYRFFFAKDHGVEINYGYSLNTQSYRFTSGTVGVRANQHEGSAAYVYRHPLPGFTPFVEAGVAALVFDPADASPLSSQARAAFVYGAGADLNLGSRVFLRAQYRGFLYNSPAFDLSATQGADRVTHRAEPSIGFGYRF